MYAYVFTERFIVRALRLYAKCKKLAIVHAP
jgi:hypothetical protein